MQCPSCQAEVRDKARFCDNCGSELNIHLYEKTLDELKNDAQNFLDNNDLNKADRILFDLHSVYPDDPDVLNLVGILHLKHKNKKDARIVFRNALKIQPNHREAKRNLRKSYLFMRVVIGSAIALVLIAGTAGYLAAYASNVAHAKQNKTQEKKVVSQNTPSTPRTDQNNASQPHDNNPTQQAPTQPEKNVTVTVDQSITQPIVQDALNESSGVIEKGVEQYITAQHLDRLFPIKIIYAEDTSGNLFTYIMATHKYGSQNDVVKDTHDSGYGLDTEEIYKLDHAWRYTKFSFNKDYFDVYRKLYLNGEDVIFVDYDKGIGVGAEIDIYGHKDPSGYAISGSPLVSNKVLLFQNSVSLTLPKPFETYANSPLPMLGTTRDGSEWGLVDDFFGLQTK